MKITVTINGITLTATGDPDEMAAYTRNITFDTATLEELEPLQLGDPWWRAIEDGGHITVHRRHCNETCIGDYDRSGAARHPTAQDYYDWLKARTASSVSIADCAR